jgi:thioester reductase-like protein
MSTIFFTGFPGFLGSRLVPLVLERDPDATVACLVQGKFADLAQSRVDELVAADRSLEGRIELVEGDLTAPDLGIAERADLARRTTEIYHLAAVYDLAVARDVGMRINVDGTRNLLRFAEECEQLQRHHYISTCYVSGRHCGPFKETDLNVGQRFNNYYEETKYLAEVDVAAARDAGMPTTIYRPSIVVGDSRTGATQKYDGPYFLLQWLLRQPTWLSIMPVVGDPSMVRLNVVPSDYVVNGIAALSAKAETVNQTYQLADPSPLTVDEMLDVIAEGIGHRVVRMPVSLKMATWMLDHVKVAQNLMQMPSQAVEYFAHPTHYDTTNAVRDLAGSDVVCPPFQAYLPAIVDFMRTHKGISSAAMI